MTEVPRTRIYDAIRVLQAQGLVEIQHGNPQEFRAVPLEEATETLHDEYEARGGLTESLEDQIHEAVPEATTFISGLEWLRGDSTVKDDVAVSRLLMSDRSTILVSSIVADTGKEQAVFGEGFGNGLVVIARRLVAHGLRTARDPK